MEALDAVFSRRSIRHYTADEVPEELVHELLRAAMSAPSAHNKQPWHFVIIDERGILNEVAQVHPWANMLREAPLAILVCGDLHIDNGVGFWIQDCAAATQNILIAAHAKGLGAVWVGIYPAAEKSAALISRLINMPEYIIPLSLIPVGYPAEKKSPVNRYDPTKIHRNNW